MRIAGAVIASLMCAAQASAGAWPREPGSGFIAIGTEVTTTRTELRADGPTADPAPDATGYRTLFAEIGLTPRLSAGVDVGGDEVWLSGMVNAELERMAKQGGATSEELALADATDRRVRTWSGVVFGQVALGALDARHRFAASLGIGQRTYEEPGLFFGLEEMRTETILRPGLAYGLGFGGAAVSGWLSVEGSVEHRMRTQGTVRKIDTTLGLKRPDSRLSYLFQVFASDFPQADPQVRLQPGVVAQVWRGLSLESGVIYDVAGADAVGFKVGLWVEW